MDPSKIDSTKSQPRGNRIVRAVKWHFGNTKCTISQEQYDKEKYLIATVKFNPWILMVAAFFVQFCCGSVYAWSVFNTPIDEVVTGDPKSSQAPVTFYVAIGVLGFSAAFMGPWLERNGPKKALVLASCSFFLGNLLSALAIYVKFMWLLYVGYGIIGGFGIGLSYIAPVSSLQKWFPHRRGLAAGFAVCGFGAGSIAVGKVILPLIDLVGLPLTFVVLGSCFFIVMFGSAFLFRVPPPDYSVTVSDGINTKGTDKQEITFTMSESIKSAEYVMLYLMLFSNTLFGLVIISRMSNMIIQLYGVDPDQAATIVSINGAFNLFGRIFFSAISDKIGRKTAFLIMLTTQTVIISTFALYTENDVYWLFLVCMFAITMCYGGGFGVIPAFLADMFGSGNISVYFGLILTAWSIAGVGGGLTFTAVYNGQMASGEWTTADAYPYVVNTYWILAFVIAGLLCAIFVKTSIKDRVLPRVKGQWFRFRMFGKVVRIKRVTTCPEVEVLSSQKYDEEWEEYLKSRTVVPRP